MNYELQRSTERFGELELELATIADLDRAVDEFCGDAERESAEAERLRGFTPYFGVVWPAARALALHLVRLGRELEGRTVLELGCGLAVPSLVAAKLGARVTASDVHPDVPSFLRRNLELNDLAAGAVDYRELDWLTGQPLGTFDFVLGSEILYEASHPRLVARALAAHAHVASRIVLSDPGRAYLQACLDELASLGFAAETSVAAVADPRRDRAGDPPTREIFVIVLERR